MQDAVYMGCDVFNWMMYIRCTINWDVFSNCKGDLWTRMWPRKKSTSNKLRIKDVSRKWLSVRI